jgi:hypothetical protein
MMDKSLVPQDVLFPRQIFHKTLLTTRFLFVINSLCHKLNLKELTAAKDFMKFVLFEVGMDLTCKLVSQLQKLHDSSHYFAERNEKTKTEIIGIGRSDAHPEGLEVAYKNNDILA